jgi:23S rRNA pseudouridine2604 synthase
LTDTLTEKIRLSKIMAQRGMCSRREADKYIEQGLVSVDGERISVLGTRIFPNQQIELHKEALEQQSSRATVLLHKPPGYVSGLPEMGYESAVMLVTQGNAANQAEKAPDRQGLAPAGRLDIDSTGLIVFTQDGRIARQLIGADSTIEKEYIVNVSGGITLEKLERLRHGLTLDEKALKPAIIEETEENQLKFILNEGRKRQIRRMCELVDLEVRQLKRTRIGKITVSGIPRGNWRLLRHDEQF